jgi:hypothetical protein
MDSLARAYPAEEQEIVIFFGRELKIPDVEVVGNNGIIPHLVIRSRNGLCA